MSITFTTAPQAPVAPPDRADLVIGGQVVGTIQPVRFFGDKAKWHAVIKVAGSPMDPTLLMQGFGVTQDEAVESAIRNGVKALDAFAASFRAIAQSSGVQL